MGKGFTMAVCELCPGYQCVPFGENEEGRIIFKLHPEGGAADGRLEPKWPVNRCVVREMREKGNDEGAKIALDALPSFTENVAAPLERAG